MSERGSAGEGETVGVMVGASIWELGTRDQSENVKGELFPPAKPSLLLVCLVVESRFLWSSKTRDAGGEGAEPDNQTDRKEEHLIIRINIFGFDAVCSV